MAELNVVVTGAGRDLGRALAAVFAQRGDTVFLSARSSAAAERTRDELTADGHAVRAHRCDLADPESIRAFAAGVGGETGHVDLLINNAATWLEGSLEEVDDEEVVGAVNATVAGTALMVKHFLPLLLKSERPDVVTMVSAAGVPGAYENAGAHSAYFAAKSGQSGLVNVLSARLRKQGVRMISLYPPDFNNFDALGPEWSSSPRGRGDGLTSMSIAECIAFAVDQPRDCYIQALHFAA